MGWAVIVITQLFLLGKLALMMIRNELFNIFRNINLESLRVHLSARKVDGGRCNFFAAMFSPVVVLDLYCILYYSSHVKSDTS